MRSSTVRVVLVDDHPVVRRGLCALLDDEPGVDVVGEAADGNEAVELVKDLEPDVVVMDVSMRGLNGIEATQRIMQQSNEVSVLCLSLHTERPVVSAMLRAGASGYVVKASAPDELVTAVRTVASKRTFLSPVIAGGVVSDYVSRLDGAIGDEPTLTSRQYEILQLIAEGDDTATIAERLSISKKTVGAHREHIMKKLDLHSIAALTKYAIREGITTLERDQAL